MHDQKKQDKLDLLRTEKQVFAGLTIMLLIIVAIGGFLLGILWSTIPNGLSLVDRVSMLAEKSTVLILVTFLAQMFVVLPMLKEWFRILLKIKTINRDIREIEAQSLAQRLFQQGVHH